ncbi:uncharacterized protein LOC142639421 [Castanea sativa]|uniref:uncharacterized protein LOC142639421 n=1 Tax=Castanea sativa TaxID=21020 RepID=UPI003F64FE53
MEVRKTKLHLLNMDPLLKQILMKLTCKGISGLTMQMEDLLRMCNEGPWAVDGALLILEKWKPNLVFNKLHLNFISIWVPFHDLPLEYQYPEMAKILSQIMGALEKVDKEDRFPRNIRFLRAKVRIDPWMPMFFGFKLRLDDGTRTWIQCRYERVHKLYTRCGMIGHTRGQ